MRNGWEEPSFVAWAQLAVLRLGGPTAARGHNQNMQVERNK